MKEPKPVAKATTLSVITGFAILAAIVSACFVGAACAIGAFIGIVINVVVRLI